MSWIRRSDLMILTIGETTYTQDKRFSPIHERGSDVWILKVRGGEAIASVRKNGIKKNGC